jgi:hypothetical protein
MIEYAIRGQTFEYQSPAGEPLGVREVVYLVSTDPQQPRELLVVGMGETTRAAVLDAIEELDAAVRTCREALAEVDAQEAVQH